MERMHKLNRNHPESYESARSAKATCAYIREHRGDNTTFSSADFEACLPDRLTAEEIQEIDSLLTKTFEEIDRHELYVHLSKKINGHSEVDNFDAVMQRFYDRYIESDELVGILIEKIKKDEFISPLWIEYSEDFDLVGFDGLKAQLVEKIFKKYPLQAKELSFELLDIISNGMMHDDWWYGEGPIYPQYEIITKDTDKALGQLQDLYSDAVHRYSLWTQRSIKDTDILDEFKAMQERQLAELKSKIDEIERAMSDLENENNFNLYHKIITNENRDIDELNQHNFEKAEYETNPLLTSAILKELAQSAEESDIQNILRYVTQNPMARARIGEVAIILEKIGTPKVVEQLLGAIESTDDSILKKVLTKILYRTEYLAMGVDDDGLLMYMDTKIDLGDDTGTFDAFQRISRQGHIGLFRGGVLKKHIDMTEWSRENVKQAMQLQAKSFLYEQVFVSSGNETDVERRQREEMLEKLKNNYTTVHEDIRVSTDIHLENLSLIEQGQFMLYYADLDVSAKQELQSFVRQYGENGVRAFLSMTVRGEAIDDILTIGSELQPEIAHSIFQVFAGSIHQLEDSLVELKEKYMQADVLLPPTTHFAIIKRAQKILQKYANLIRKNADEGEKDKVIDIKELQNITQDSIFLTGVVKEYVKQVGVEVFNFEDFKDLSHENIPAKDVTPEDATRMRAIYKGNYEKQYPKEFTDALLDSFDASLKKDNATYEVLKYNGEVVAFFRYDDEGIDPNTGKYTLHMAAVNINPKYAHGGLAEIMLERSLLQKTTKSIIVAECIPESPAHEIYKKIGFDTTDYGEFKGVKIANIRLNQKSSMKKLLAA